MVNRVWQHHFGQGIVKTPSNFGLNGERPTHPELLDYLAAQLMESRLEHKSLAPHDSAIEHLRAFDGQ